MNEKCAFCRWLRAPPDQILIQYIYEQLATWVPKSASSKPSYWVSAEAWPHPSAPSHRALNETLMRLSWGVPEWFISSLRRLVAMATISLTGSPVTWQSPSGQTLSHDLSNGRRYNQLPHPQNIMRSPNPFMPSALEKKKTTTYTHSRRSPQHTMLQLWSNQKFWVVSLYSSSVPPVGQNSPQLMEVKAHGSLFFFCVCVCYPESALTVSSIYSAFPVH